jgi:hypothetical protein
VENFNLTYLLIGLLILLITYLLGRVHGKGTQQAPGDLIEIYNSIQVLPTKVLQVLQGSINPQKGKMAELLTYAELRYDYDRIIPLGWPIDFIGIKNNERIDFIEVKSGTSFRLTEEENHIKNLVQKGDVYFRLIKVTEEEISKFLSSKDK